MIYQSILKCLFLFKQDLQQWPLAACFYAQCQSRPSPTTSCLKSSSISSTLQVRHTYLHELTLQLPHSSSLR
ncbi:hypothetical protein FGO68_gene12304 [Halteria grandinella]|uniref:Uncharacterized protein n=1 Tax=Halteria grandinella TaxID=5974 RepID=A0A8J8NGV5_HALGN|nr:hypothetical protein FGO68_gene12304 [Halteria grandinella]